MPTPAPSWNTHRVLGTWNRQDGTMRAGTYKATVPVRVTNQTDRVIIPAGVFAEGALNTTPGVPSLDILLPATDDIDNLPQGWQMVLEVTFLDAAGERYDLDLPVGGETDLVDVILTESLPIPKELLVRGVPGGIAELDADGDVIDAAGDKVGAGLDEAALGTYLTTGQYVTQPALTTATSGLVPSTRTVAGKPLSGNVSLVKADVGLANVDNTTDAAKPVSTAQQTALDAKAPIASPTFTGTVSGVTKAHVGLGSVDNTSDAAKPVSTAQQTALDAKAPIASPTFTGTVSGVTKTHVGLGNVDNTSDANKPVSSATQTALNLKAPLASPTFTGTVSGVTKAHVGLGNVDNTSDVNKPVSTAVTTALAGKTATVAIGTATTSQRIVIVPTAGEYTGGQAGDIVLVLSV